MFKPSQIILLTALCIGLHPGALQGKEAAASTSEAHWIPMERAPRTRTRPINRLSHHQHDARRWWQAKGYDHVSDGEIDALAEGLRRAAPSLETAARLERVELERLRRRFKDTQDLAGVALAIFELQEEGIIQPFQWVADAGDWNKGTILEVDDLLYNRVNNCFCFLNLCAWLAGSQPVDHHFRPIVSHGAWGSPGSPGFSTLEGETQPGAVVVVDVWFPGFNNEYSFHHIGIVVGDGEVVHLSSKDLHKDPIDVAFAPWKRGIYMGPFHWDGFIQDHTWAPSKP